MAPKRAYRQRGSNSTNANNAPPTTGTTTGSGGVSKEGAEASAKKAAQLNVSSAIVQAQSTISLLLSSNVKWTVNVKSSNTNTGMGAIKAAKLHVSPCEIVRSLLRDLSASGVTISQCEAVLTEIQKIVDNQPIDSSLCNVDDVQHVFTSTPSIEKIALEKISGSLSEEDDKTIGRFASMVR